MKPKGKIFRAENALMLLPLIGILAVALLIWMHRSAAEHPKCWTTGKTTELHGKQYDEVFCNTGQQYWVNGDTWIEK